MLSILAMIGLVFAPGFLKSGIKIIYSIFGRISWCFRRKITMKEILIICLGILFLAFDGIHFLRRKNYYLETGTPLNSPSYMLRNYFRDYLKKLNVKEMENKIDLPTSSMIKDNSLRLTYLNEQMRRKSFQKLYNIFGEDVVLNCLHCTEDQIFDYCLMYLRNILPSYMIFYCIMAVLTLNNQKYHWRTFFLVTFLIMFFLESVSTFWDQVNAIIDLDSIFKFMKSDFMQYEILWIIRIIYFFSMLAITSLWDLKNTSSSQKLSIEMISRNLEFFKLALKFLKSLPSHKLLQTDSEK